jgi:hypothetical protein
MFIETTINSFVGTSTPTFIGDTRIDGYVGKRPVILRKMKGGMLMPVLGTTVSLPYGSGKVIGYSDEKLLVNVTEFNGDYEFINADETEIYDASETVARHNSALRTSLATIISDYSRLYKSEITGKLSPNRQAKLDSYIPEITETTVCVALDGQFLKGSDKVVAQVIAKPKMTPAERRKQRRLEIADAKRLADALLENETAPTDVQDELNEMYGDDDGEF